MTTRGIEAVFLETHNWGRAARFFQALGFELELETDHQSGQLRNGDGPTVFIAEIPADRQPGLRLVLQVDDADDVVLDPAVEVVSGFADTHFGTREMTVRDPDGRLWSLQAPVPDDEPDGTAVRTALWRALHVELDAPPHVLDDRLGLQLAAPDDAWRDRPDMDPQATRGFRAAIVARARFVEDLVAERAAAGVTQYVILGAGLDTLAERRADLGTHLRIFEVDRPGTQAWKRRRLEELGIGIPEWLRLVPVDFETAASWWDGLVAAGFDAARAAVVVSTGVSMYLTKDATAAMLRQLAAALAPGSTVVMTFLVPAELVDDADRPGLEASSRGARSSGTPFISFYTPDEMVALAVDAGFAAARHVAGHQLAERYFAGRADGLRPSSGEHLVVATT
jgi:methyltransferase (TIGR00027 family)